MLFKEMVDVYSENNMKLIYSVRKMQLLNVKADGTYNYHSAL
jgi:hypothetical protein